MLELYLQSKVSIAIISIIWGMGLSTLFHKTCVQGNCQVINFQGPPLKDNDYYWTYGTKQCYKLVPYVVKC